MPLLLQVSTFDVSVVCRISTCGHFILVDGLRKHIIHLEAPLKLVCLLQMLKCIFPKMSSSPHVYIMFRKFSEAFKCLKVCGIKHARKTKLMPSCVVHLLLVYQRRQTVYISGWKKRMWCKLNWNTEILLYLINLYNLSYLLRGIE